MRVAILYQSNSEHERKVLEFAHDFKATQQDRKIDLIDLNTRDGAALAQLYDVVQYPAILALADDGHMLQLWQGEQLPLMNEVAYYQAR
jgi:hypothetical protein